MIIDSKLLLGVCFVFQLTGCDFDIASEKTSASEFDTTHTWPQLFGPNRDGISEETGWSTEFPQGEPEVLWRKRKIGIGFSSFAVYGGDLYTMGSDGENDILYCFSRTTGKERWRHEYPCRLYASQHEGGPASTPAVDEEGVYILSREGLFRKLSRDNGDPIWSLLIPTTMGATPPHFGFTCSPLLEGERIYLDVGALLAFDKRTGELAWLSTGFFPSHSSPIAFECFDVPLVAGFNGYGLTVANRDNGREVCRFRWKTFTDINAVIPIVHENRVFISSGYRTGGAVVELASSTVLASADSIDGATIHLSTVSEETANFPEVVWQNKEMSNHYSTSILFEGHLYGFDEATVKCVDFETGQPIWGQDGFGKGSLFIADGKLVILSEQGELAFAHATPEGYSEISRAHILGGKCWTAPVLSEGLLYARNASGDVVCLDLRSKAVSQESPTP